MGGVVEVGGCGGLAPSSEGDGRPAAVKGFCGWLFEGDGENGFAEFALDVAVENGFADDDIEEGFAPNSVSPILTAGPGARSFAFGEGFFSCLFSDEATPVILVALNALILPSLRRQALRRHVHMYSRLSCSGKLSGKSPFNSRRRTMISSHTLHFASDAQGGVAGSSHV